MTTDLGKEIPLFPDVQYIVVRIRRSFALTITLYEICQSVEPFHSSSHLNTDFIKTIN